MLEQKLPVLIFAQCGRFLAQSATQAGYTVWVVDCFGDQDTLTVTDRWQKIPPLKQLDQQNILNTLLEITRGQKCNLVCGGGIESHYPFLTQLPDNIHLLGNSPKTIHTVKTPRLFFELLSRFDIAYPPTQLSPPDNTKNWLAKSASGLGGSHIQYLATHFQPIDHYFQAHILGLSGSAIFLANGQHAIVLSINQQKSLPTNKHASFTLWSIETPWAIAEQHQRQLEQAVSKIVVEAQLIGLNSIDFIISEKNELLILEINPRPSASTELIQAELPLIQHHINACQGRLPEKVINQFIIKSSLRYIFTSDDVIIPNGMHWPSGCHDLPAANTSIKKGDPICTSIIQATDFQQADQQHDAIENKINQQIRQSR
ncbi:MAG: hypothetical protein COB23_00040 [Methylophaga sp.]|nr:MAG: hypothetical protein COB23_00040 [Methylophaga sp.]